MIYNNPKLILCYFFTQFRVLLSFFSRSVFALLFLPPPSRGCMWSSAAPRSTPYGTGMGCTCPLLGGAQSWNGRCVSFAARFSLGFARKSIRWLEVKRFESLHRIFFLLAFEQSLPLNLCLASLEWGLYCLIFFTFSNPNPNSVFEYCLHFSIQIPFLNIVLISRSKFCFWILSWFQLLFWLSYVARQILAGSSTSCPAPTLF